MIFCVYIRDFFCFIFGPRDLLLLMAIDLGVKSQYIEINVSSDENTHGEDDRINVSVEEEK